GRLGVTYRAAGVSNRGAGRRALAPTLFLSFCSLARTCYNGCMIMHSPRGTQDPAITFWGAAQSVTGSMHLVEVGGRRILLDCGRPVGPRADARRRTVAFPFRPRDIDVVVLSHAHMDHSGNLPHLVRQGFRGPIYCT